MFQRFILPAVIAAVLIINKSFKLPSDSHAQQSQSQLPVLVRDGPQLSLTSHFILSMRVIRNKPQGPVCRNKLVLLYLCNLLLAESYAPEPNLDRGLSSFLVESAVKLVSGQRHVCAVTHAIYGTIRNVWGCLMPSSKG